MPQAGWRWTIGAMALLALAAVPAAAADCGGHGNMPMVTVVSGAASANRTASTPADRLLSTQKLAFDAARVYSADALAALAFADVALLLPYDGQRHVFSGPPLAALLADAGAAGRGVAAQALDGYGVSFTVAELAALHPILALCRDGQPLGVGDLGPGFVLFAPAAGERPTDAEADRMVWGVYFLRPL